MAWSRSKGTSTPHQATRSVPENRRAPSRAISRVSFLRAGCRLGPGPELGLDPGDDVLEVLLRSSGASSQHLDEGFDASAMLSERAQRAVALQHEQRQARFPESFPNRR